MYRFSPIVSALAAALVTGILIAPTVYAQDKSGEPEYRQALRMMEKCDFNKAHKHMNRALKLEPDNAEYHFFMGFIQAKRTRKGILFSKLGRAISCRKHWERAVELCPDSAMYLAYLMQYHMRAPGIAGGDKDESSRLLGRIFAIDSSTGYWVQAKIALHNDDFEQAEKLLLRLLADKYDTLNVLCHLGHLYNHHRQDPQRARAYYQRVLAADPDDLIAVFCAGELALMDTGQAREAVGFFADFLNHPFEPNQPSRAAAHWQMGLAYEQLGQADSAKVSYQLALELNPGLTEAEESLKRLEAERCP